MKPKLSQIQCVAAFISEISTKANLQFDPNKGSHLQFENLEIESKLMPKPEGEQPRQVTLKVSLDSGKEKNAPYSFSVEVIGFFQCHNVAVESQERFIEIQGSSVLYGMARDALLDVMTKGPFDSVFLPLVSFYRNGEKSKPTNREKKAPNKQATKKSAKKSVSTRSK